MKKRIISLLLTVVMVFAMLPMMGMEAAAAENSWMWPAPGCYVVSSNFGNRDLDGNGAMDDTHTGIDIIGTNATFGQPVIAAKSGTVLQYCNAYGDNEKTGPSGMASFGNYVIIHHGDGTYSIYAHMRQGGIKTGGSVAQGDVIGYIGDSGNSYGIHLHFQIFKDPSWLSRVLLNPMPTNSNIRINNTYSLPSGWPSEKITYIFKGDASSSGDYASQCKFQYSYCTIEAKSGTKLHAEPRDASSVVRNNAGGETYTATGLFQNEYGNWWYRTSYNGQTCYIWAPDTNFKEARQGAYVSSPVGPTALNVGDRFSIKGVVTSDTDYTKILRAGAYITALPEDSNRICDLAEGVSGNSYSLLNSAVDMAMTFNTLGIGWYRYRVYAEEESYYWDGAQLARYTKTPVVWYCDFSVGNAGEKPTQQTTCTSHSGSYLWYEKDHPHKNYYKCSVCGETYTDGTTTKVADCSQCNPPATDYLSQCTFRRSCLTANIIKSTTMKTLPCSKGTNAASKDVRNMAVGDEVKVIGLYQNTQKNWWYKVTYGNLTGYIYAGDTELAHYDFATTITGAAGPSVLSVGQRFSIKGTINSELTQLKQVGATIKSNGKTVMQFYENTTGPYDLLNSKIDYAMRFNELPEGWYEYQVYVGEDNAYSDGKNIYPTTCWPAIFATKFKVGNPAPTGIDVYWCGRKVAFDQLPTVISGRTMVPVRAIFEAMGIKVDWNATQKKVTASQNGVTVELTVDNTVIKTFMAGVLSNSTVMDTAAKIIGGRTLIPARYIAEAFGYSVRWDADTKTVYIEN